MITANNDILPAMVMSHDTPSSDYYARLEELLSSTSDIQQLYKTIVNAPFHDKRQTIFMGLGIIVLLRSNPEQGTLDRIALSETEQAEGAVSMTVVPFKEILIPLDYEDNLLIQVMRSGEPARTHDWQYLFIPALTPEEARFNQAGAGIGCSAVYPLMIPEGGALIFSYFLPPEKINAVQETFMEKYSNLVSQSMNALLEAS